jgi:hypothetical protein
MRVRASASICLLRSPAMSPHDQKRLAALIRNFVEECGFVTPFHLVVIDSRGTTSVTRYGDSGVEQICSGPARGNRLNMLPPLVVTCIRPDGVGRSAKIQVVERERVTLQ